MNGYVAEVLEISYVIVYKFQSHNAYAHPILTNLEEGYITDESLDEVPDGVLKVKLSIKETNKQGLDQIQEDICK